MTDKPDNIEELKKTAYELPRSAGVYMFKDDRGRVLYIGKAKDLRSRVRSYFTGKHADHKTDVMLEAARSLEILEAPSEVDALLFETRLIKDLQPKFNVLMKDGKSHPFVAIERKGEFPRVFITRGKNFKNVTYYGPFIDATGLRRAFKALQKVFKFRTCNLEIEPDASKRRRHRPCLLYNVKICSGPCGGRISSEEYKARVNRFRKMLLGKRKYLIRELRRAMRMASARLEYEKAAEYRDEIRALESLEKMARSGDFVEAESLAIDPAKGVEALMKEFGMKEKPRVIDGVDIATLQGGDSVGSIVRFVDGVPFKAGYRRYKIKSVEGVDDYAMMREVVSRRFKRFEGGDETPPDVLLLDGGKGQLHAAKEVAKEFKTGPAVIASLAKKEETIFLSTDAGDEEIKLPRRSPALRMLMYVRDESHRFAQHYHHILRHKSVSGRGKSKKKKTR